MRDPNRIDRVTETLRRVWHLVPDWRMGQLLCNIARDGGSWDSFYLEDDKLEDIALSWLAKTEDQAGITVLYKEHFSNFQDAVEAALSKCEGQNFEIRSNPDHTYELIYDSIKEVDEP